MDILPSKDLCLAPASPDPSIGGSFSSWACLLGNLGRINRLSCGSSERASRLPILGTGHWARWTVPTIPICLLLGDEDEDEDELVAVHEDRYDSNILLELSECIHSNHPGVIDVTFPSLVLVSGP